MFEILSRSKRCSCCLELKDRSEYNKRSRSKDGLRSECKDCQSKEHAEYREINIDRERQRISIWQKSNPAKMKAKRDRYLNKNRDKVNLASRLWKALNPKKAAKSNRKAKQKRREVDRQQRHLWMLKNPDKNREYCNARRARKNNAQGRFTDKEWQLLKAKYNNMCLCCKRNDVKLVPDHVVPLAIGGSNGIENIQPLCGLCNSKKRAKTIDYR